MIGTTLKEQIINTVNLRPGIKNVELVLAIFEFTNPLRFNEAEYQKALKEAIDKDEIIEMEFVLPSLDYRIKACYFPKGTKFTISKGM